MEDSLFILLFVLILITSVIIMYITLNNKKETFSSCKNIDDPVDGICMPYYGIAPANVINPSPNNAELNRKAAKFQCDNTPGCTGFFQNKIMQKEAYLCKPEWDRSKIVPMSSDIYDFETYKCSDNDLFEGPGKNAQGNYPNTINLMGADTNIYTRSLNKKHLSYYDDKVFDSENVILEETQESVKPVLTMPLPYLSEISEDKLLEEVMKMKIDEIIAEASSIDNCIGFTVFLKQGDSHVKFYQKVPGKVVRLLNKSSSETSYIVRSYYAKITTNPIQAVNLSNLKLHRNHFWGYMPFIKIQDFTAPSRGGNRDVWIHTWANNALLLWVWNDWGGTQNYNHGWAKPALFLKTGNSFKRLGMHPSPGHGFDSCQTRDGGSVKCWIHWVDTGSKGTCIGLWWD